MWEAIFGLIGVVVGSGLLLLYNYYRDHREREEKYRVMLYDKRLEAHQGAYYHVEQLLFSFGYRLYGPPLTKDMRTLCREAEEFYDSNCLYLDEQSRGEIVMALLLIKEICYSQTDEKQKQEAFNQLVKAQKAVEA